MKDSPKRPYHHGDLRRVILETAMDMLGTDGGWQFTLREVARRAGVSHAAPYKHFPDKTALLSELALIGFDLLREEVMKTQNSVATSIHDELKTAAQAYIGFGLANPSLYRLMFSAEASNSSDVHLSERALSAFALLLELLERGQKDGTIRKHPIRGQAAACWAQMHGLTMLAIDGLLRPEKVGPDAVEAALLTLREGLEP